MGFVRVVNMIPVAQSGETNQDSEPSLAVNPARPTDMVATAFTPDPGGGGFAPIYVSTDRGETWDFRKVLPGGPGTADVSVGFATTGGVLYAAILNGQSFFGASKQTRMQVLRTPTFAGTTPMTVLVDRTLEDQPWVVAGSVVVNGRSVDRVYVGSKDTQPRPFVGAAAAVDVSLDAATAPSPAGFQETALGLRRGPFSMPPTRIALHPDGTVYAAFIHVTRVFADTSNMDFEVVVRRDDNWGGGADAFSHLARPFQKTPGVTVATGFARFGAIVGQERIGADLAIAVDPTDSSTVYIAWCDRSGGPSGTDWRLNVARSDDRGMEWKPVHEVVPIAKNPALAITAEGRVGLAYQQLTANQWVTRLEVTASSWQTPPEIKVLHQAPAAVPVSAGLPYLGDYMRLIAVDKDFYGVFSGSNAPDLANFPSGVRYQRRADFVNKVLLNVDGVSPVAISIDPFFFHWSRSRVKPFSETKPGLTKAEADTPPKSIKAETKEIGETKPGITKAEADTPPKSVKAETKELGESKPGATKAELDLPRKGVFEHGPKGTGSGDPDPFGTLLQKLERRLGVVEEQVAQGRPFIRRDERPDVGTIGQSPQEE
jgi:hypothetical protein